ncbi:MAG: RNA 2',3'-cyclic phosphodiesterase [Pirellulales bacterium]
MNLRTFIAVAASSEIRHGAARLISRLRLSAGDVRWTPTDNLHWTLQFLGDVDEREIPAVCDAVAEASVTIEPFDLIAQGAGAFPSPDRPRTLWLGAGQGRDAMIALQSAIEHPLKKLGFRGEDRRYVPHLTLGRAGRHGCPPSFSTELAALADFDAGSMLVDEVTIIASTLAREGSEYRVLAHAPLG